MGGAILDRGGLRSRAEGEDERVSVLHQHLHDVRRVDVNRLGTPPIVDAHDGRERVAHHLDEHARDVLGEAWPA